MSIMAMSMQPATTDGTVGTGRRGIGMPTTTVATPTATAATGTGAPADVSSKAFVVDSESMLRLPFPWALHEMLNQVDQNGLSTYVSWNSDGTSFKVHDTESFVKYVAPLYFKQTRYKSFQRQLHLYGFTRIAKGKYRGYRAHELFVRSNKQLCMNMKRNKKSTSTTSLPSAVSSNSLSSDNNNGIKSTKSKSTPPTIAITIPEALNSSTTTTSTSLFSEREDVEHDRQDEEEDALSDMASDNNQELLQEDDEEELCQYEEQKQQEEDDDDDDEDGNRWLNSFIDNFVSTTTFQDPTTTELSISSLLEPRPVLNMRNGDNNGSSYASSFNSSCTSNDDGGWNNDRFNSLVGAGSNIVASWMMQQHQQKQHQQQQHPPQHQHLQPTIHYGSVMSRNHMFGLMEKDRQNANTNNNNNNNTLRDVDGLLADLVAPRAA